MNENRVVPLRQPDEIDDPLTEILRCGAKRLVQQAVEAEFAAFLARHADLELPDGRQRVVRHGHDPARPNCETFLSIGGTTSATRKGKIKYASP
jgi:putative transposase